MKQHQHTCRRTNSHAHTHTHKLACAYTHTQTCMRIHTCAYTHTQTHTHARLHARTHARTHTHTCMHNTHAHAHAHAQQASFGSGIMKKLIKHQQQRLVKRLNNSQLSKGPNMLFFDIQGAISHPPTHQNGTSIAVN